MPAREWAIIPHYGIIFFPPDGMGDIGLLDHK